MKPTFLLCALAAFGLSGVHAEELTPSTELMRRGDAVLTVADVDARLSRLPQEERQALASNHEQMASLLDRIVLNRQLAMEARELGLDKSPDARRDLELAVEEVLAVHRLSHEASPERAPDFVELARERYLVDPTPYQTPASRLVKHILITSTGRSEIEAMAMAEDMRSRALAPGADFQALVDQYSEDPGKADNQGSYRVTVDGQFVPEFQEAAFELDAEGDISTPVKTQFGYHILLLEEIAPASQKSFEEVREAIVTELRAARAIEAREALRILKRQEDESGNEEALRKLPQRYGAVSPQEASSR